MANSTEGTTAGVKDEKQENKTTLYGLLKYKMSRNVGDEVQSLAARQFLPRVDEYLDRDALSERTSEAPLRLIANSWWAHAPKMWPPSPAIKPLLVSMHITKETAREWTKPERREYLLQHGPVGCRDQDTVNKLTAADVPAYFSGCMTLTYPPYDGERSGEILFVDPFGPYGPDRWSSPGKPNFHNDWWEKIPAEVRQKSSFISHKSRLPSRPFRFAQAQKLLNRYRQASLVVTARMHCALPCVAFGTPVIFVHAGYMKERFEGLLDGVPSVTHDQVSKGEWDVNWDNPPLPADRDYYRGIAQRLKLLCNKFVETGENNAREIYEL